MGYVRSLASKSDFPIDTEAEKKGKSAVNEEAVASDPHTQTFPSKAVLDIQGAASRELFSHMLDSTEKELQDAHSLWQMRQAWSSSCSAQGFKAVKLDDLHVREPQGPSPKPYTHSSRTSKPPPPQSEVLSPFASRKALPEGSMYTFVLWP